MDLQDHRLLVMGANGVLGSTIGRLLSDRGALVLGTARDAGSSSRLEGGLHERLLLDLTDDGSIRQLADYLLASGIDGVVNAAGLVGFASAADTPAAGADLLLRVNHAGPARLMAALIPALRASAAAGRGAVLCSITGVVAERAFPGMSAYVASKTAHSAWLAAVRLDLRRDGIRVLDARPGHTETGLATRPAFGTAPRFPAGLAPELVATRIVEALAGDATELPSSAFAA